MQINAIYTLPQHHKDANPTVGSIKAHLAPRIISDLGMYM